MAAEAARQFAYAWIALTLALACHVLDEATHNFLSVYNPAVLQMRAALPWLPIPTFGFTEWIAALTLAVMALMALSPFAFQGRRWMVAASYPYFGFMLANGLAHIASSVYVGEFLPGVYSSPLLLAAAVHLWFRARDSRGWSYS